MPIAKASLAAVEVSGFAGGAIPDGKLSVHSPSYQRRTGRSASAPPTATWIYGKMPAIFARPFQARKLFKLLKLHTLPKRLQLPNDSSLLSPIPLSGRQCPGATTSFPFIPGSADAPVLCCEQSRNDTHRSPSRFASCTEPRSLTPQSIRRSQSHEVHSGSVEFIMDGCCRRSARADSHLWLWGRAVRSRASAAPARFAVSMFGGE